jgi:hypothetical protein
MRLVRDENGHLLLQPRDVSAGRGEHVFEARRRRRGRGREGRKDDEGEESAGYQSPVARVFSTDILRGVPRVTDEV